MAKLSQVFQFGRCQFTVEDDDPRLIKWIESALLPCPTAPAGELPESNQPGAEVIIETLRPLECSEDINSLSWQYQQSLRISGLLRRLYDRHVDCIWIDAATVRAPDGKLVLVSGPSCAGKTTLALAMSLSRGWTILSEDITLIDPGRNAVLACPAPSGIRAGTADKLMELCHSSERICAEDGWFFDKNLYFSESVPAKFDMAVFLEPFAEIGNGAASEMSLQSLSAYEYIKSVLPHSNLLRLDNKIGVLHEAIESSCCVKVSGGTLRERVELLVQVQQAGGWSKEVW